MRLIESKSTVTVMHNAEGQNMENQMELFFPFETAVGILYMFTLND